MPSMKYEQQSLLPAEQTISVNSDGGSSTTLASTSTDDEDHLECGISSANQNLLKTKSKRLSRRRHRHQIHRGARRIARLLLCMLLVPMFFLMLYLPLYSNVQTRHAALPDWGFNTSRNIVDYVLPENDTTLLEPRNICGDKVFLLIMVCSSMHNFAERQTIRETWGNTTEFNYGMFEQLHSHLHGQYLEPMAERLKYYSEYLKISDNETTVPPVLPVRIVFLIGRSKDEALLGNESIVRIHNEAAHYDDIVQENFIDTYNNLTLKSVLALKWAAKRCLHKSAFFIKCDDDTFVNVPNLLHFLLGGTVPLYNDTLEYYDLHTYQALAPHNRLNITHSYMTGHLFCTARPVANVTSKWYMPSYMFPADKYPRYLSGAGYLMSMDVVQRLYETALNTSFIYLEDVYITGMCARRAHIRSRHSPLFGYTRSKDWCSFKGTITQHEMKDDSMVEAYNFVANTSQRCPPPNKFFKHIRLRKNNNCT